MELYSNNNITVKDNVPDLYILSCGVEENIKTIELSEKLRKSGYIIEKDVFERSFKSQMKYANKLNCKNLIVIGEDEIKTNKAKIKNMETGEEKEIELNIETIKQCL